MTAIMKTIQMIRKSDHVKILSQGKIANTYYSRLRGLIGVKDFNPGQGLLFPRNNSIHMWMMSMPIDVLFLKKTAENEWRVESLFAGLKPWKLLPVFCLKADDTLELPVGTISRLSIQKGEVLCIAS